MTDIKQIKVLWNGKVIGSHPDKGDPTGNHQAGLLVLKEAGIERGVGKAPQLTALGQARSFGTASVLIYKIGFTKSPFNPHLVAPLIVNTAFCIEVFIKALGQFRGTTLRGHDLQPLFDQLPQADQQTLQTTFNERVEARKLSQTSLRDSLAAMNKAFIEWRYLYENEKTLTFEVGLAVSAIEAFDRVTTVIVESERVSR